MSPAAFIDTNIPIYAAGRAHPLKEPCRQVLRLIASDSQAFVTSAEVLQEMLHIYLARQEWSQGRQVFQDFLVLMQDRVEAVLVADVQRAAIMYENSVLPDSGTHRNDDGVDVIK